MARTQTIKFGDFMDGSYKAEKKDVNKLTRTLVKAGCMVPLALTPKVAFASGIGDAVGQGTGVVANKITGTSLYVLAHALDPVTQILIAISLPIASVVMIGGCFFFMFNRPEKAWATIMNAGLGYILIQLSPLFVKILEEVGKSL